MSKNVCHIFQQRKNIYIILDILQRISENSNVTRAEKNTQHCQLKLCQMEKKEKERKSNPSTCREEIWSQNSQPDKKKKKNKSLFETSQNNSEPNCPHQRKITL